MELTNTLKQIFDYLSNSIMLQSIKKRFYENYATEKAWYEIYNMFEYDYKDSELSLDERIADALTKDVYRAWHDENVYMKNLLTELNTIGLRLTPFELRLKDDYEILYKAPNTLPTKIINEIDRIVVTDHDYFMTVYFNDYYFKSNILFSDLLHFFFTVYVGIKAYQNFLTNFITIENDNITVLTNYLKSFGFVFAEDIPDYLKSQFAVKLFEHFRTKGSELGLLDIINYSMDATKQIYGIYMYLDENTDDIICVKIPYSQMDSTNEMFLNYLKKTDEEKLIYQVDYNYITQQDPEWHITNDELKEIIRKRGYIKTKYHYIDSIQTSVLNYLLNMAVIIERWIPNDVIYFNIREMQDYTLTKVNSLLVAATRKVSDNSFDISSLVAEKPLTKVVCLHDPDQLKEKMQSISNIGELRKFFKDEYKLYIDMEVKRKFEQIKELDNHSIESGRSQSFDKLFGEDPLYNQLKNATDHEEIYNLWDKIYKLTQTAYNIIGINFDYIPDFIIDTLNYHKNFFSKIIVKKESEKDIGFDSPYSNLFAGLNYDFIDCPGGYLDQDEIGHVYHIKQLIKFDQSQQYKFSHIPEKMFESMEIPEWEEPEYGYCYTFSKREIYKFTKNDNKQNFGKTCLINPGTIPFTGYECTYDRDNSYKLNQYEYDKVKDYLDFNEAFLQYRDEPKDSHFVELNIQYFDTCGRKNYESAYAYFKSDDYDYLFSDTIKIPFRTEGFKGYDCFLDDLFQVITNEQNYLDENRQDNYKYVTTIASNDYVKEIFTTNLEIDMQDEGAGYLNCGFILKFNEDKNVKFVQEDSRSFVFSKSNCTFFCPDGSSECETYNEDTGTYSSTSFMYVKVAGTKEYLIVEKTRYD